MPSEASNKYELNEAGIFGNPPVSDAEFLSAMRKKLSTGKVEAPRGVFVSFRLLGLASAFCIILIAGIFFGGKFTPPVANTLNSGATTLLAELDQDESFDMNALVDDNLDISAFANYLELPDSVAQIIESDTDDNTPITDELLSLSDEQLQAVLDYIKTTNFLES